MNIQVFKQEYVRLARQFCSFNNIEGGFNDFFISAINQRYSSDASQAPWVYAVAMYVRHMEFLTNKYNGNEADQLIDAKELLQRIAPETGNLEQVEAFLEILEETFENFYGPASQIGKYLLGDDREIDGSGSRAYEPKTIKLNFETKHTIINRSAFVVDDRNDYLSLINEERNRYLDAEEEYKRAIYLSELPELEKEVDPSFGSSGGLCPFTTPQCGDPIRGGTYVGAKKCSGKVAIDVTGVMICLCPDGTAENADGICVDETSPSVAVAKAKKSKAAASEASAADDAEIDAKIAYESNKLKKRKPTSGKGKKDKNDCQFVARDRDGVYWFYKPKGMGTKKGVKYDTGKYGTPSGYSRRERKIKCMLKSGGGKDCFCKRTGKQYTTKKFGQSGAYATGKSKDYEPQSLTQLRADIKKTLT